MKTIVAIGGTGQMVIHYYIQLYLIGEVQSFKAVILDTDEIMPSLQAFQTFCQDLQHGEQRHQALGAEIPIVETLSVSRPGGSEAYQLLTGVEASSTTSRHPVNAFFSRDALSQNVRSGLFARPALSSTLSHDVLRNPALVPDSRDETVILAGSVLGGTGGGLMAPVIDALYQNAQSQGLPVKLRAVLFGEYFVADPGYIDSDQQRLQSNEALTLRSLADANTKLHSFYIIKEPEYDRIRRHTREEKQARNLVWPLKGHPYWGGVQALNYLVEDTVQDAVDPASNFADREITASAVHRSRLSANRVELQLDRAAAAANEFVRRKVVTLAAKEPFVNLIWGESLAKLIAHFWHLAREAMGPNRAMDFPKAVQRSLWEMWFSNEYPLVTLFPRPAGAGKRKISPDDFQRMEWPRTESVNPHPPLFDGEGDAARRAAATMLFHLLRRGLT